MINLTSDGGCRPNYSGATLGAYQKTDIQTVFKSALNRMLFYGDSLISGDDPERVALI